LIPRFLLTKLHLDSLKDKKTEGDIEETLQNLKKVQRLYQQHIAAQLRELKDRLKVTVTGLSASCLGLFNAQRPFTPQELEHALAVKAGSRKLDERFIPHLGEVISSAQDWLHLIEQAMLSSLFTTQPKNILRIPNNSLTGFVVA